MHIYNIGGYIRALTKLTSSLTVKKTLLLTSLHCLFKQLIFMDTLLQGVIILLLSARVVYHRQTVFFFWTESQNIEGDKSGLLIYMTIIEELCS